MSSPPLMGVLGGSSSSDFTSTSTSTSSPTTHHSSSYSNLSPSILIIIPILSITIIASVFLCYLLRHLNRRCLRHLSPSSTAISANESNHFSSRRISPETPNPAFTIVDSLPLFAFSAITRRSTSAASVVAGDCAVCLSKFEPDDQLRLLPLCCHAFHSLCVDTWLRSNQTCPLCRSPLIASDAELLKASGGDQIGNSLRLEIGTISQRQTTSDYSRETRRSYSIGSFDYIVGGVGGGRRRVGGGEEERGWTRMSEEERKEREKKKRKKGKRKKEKEKEKK
ncbi:hypothetical protein UlMin_040486 [Ulmus minor]